ncbi:hypothetical protein JXB31_01150 [Candidatus Woesearchaeota archaeon]|nr:hypothetical protein [Candidatus Woesearchaeota archaeon]
MIPLSYAITINPLEYTISKPELGKEYSIIITLINPESTLTTVSAAIDSSSEYLVPYVTIDAADGIVLEPNDKKNIKLTLSLPDELSPEKHELVVNFVSANLKMGSFRLSFVIEGKENMGLELAGMDVESQTPNNPVYLNFNLKNTGNVIVRPEPSIIIYRGESVVDSFGQESSIMIMPGQDYNLTLLYDTAKITEPGMYKAEAKFHFGGNETATLTQEFELKASLQKSSNGNEIREISPGEELMLDLDLKDPAQKLSFYKIFYSIEGTGINNFLEGELRDDNNQLEIRVDTTGLKQGDYLLNLEIHSGINLENVENKAIELKVRPKKSLLLIAIIASAAIITLLGYFSRKSIAGMFSGAWAGHTLKRAGAASSLPGIEKDIISIKKSFGQMEHEINRLGSEISSFISRSNAWSRQNLGEECFR